MTNPTLFQLIDGARQHAMSAEERRDQGISFTLGNIVVESPSLFRGTVTLAVPREAFDRATIVASMVVGHSESRIPFDPIGAVRQFRLVQQLVERHVGGERLAITPFLIRELHAAAGDPADPNFGSFRTMAIEVRGSAHVAPPPSDVDVLIDKFCAELEARWDTDEALNLGAFALWRLAWIHPFVDGNGRVSRALCYLILCLKFGFLLPGTPTLIEHLAESREQYFDALAAADLSYATTGTADLAP
ncbi:Fic family protein [Thiocapsa sp. UBA6158]|uniref:Fic family protein n=1 Tax=Thiocapsa sp. UBA6158 TaxID=1947692 RepID=UPI0025CEE2B3|nr:Fic family protein [Thiocapsa sp. UBA6158]